MKLDRPNYTYLAFSNRMYGVTVTLEEHADNRTYYTVVKTTKVKKKTMRSVVWSGFEYLAGKDAFAKEIAPYI